MWELFGSRSDRAGSYMWSKEQVRVSLMLPLYYYELQNGYRMAQCQSCACTAANHAINSLIDTTVPPADGVV